MPSRRKRGYCAAPPIDLCKAAPCHIPIFELHEAALRDAGLREIGVI
jgi:hypothetical protein